MTESVDIIIPTFNRSVKLARVLPSYQAQAGVGRIIIVDDASEPATTAVIERAARGDPRIVALRHARRRLLEATRNTGLAASRSRFVLFGEDDVELQSDYLGVIRNCLAAHEAAAVAGRLLPEDISIGPEVAAPAVSARELIDPVRLAGYFHRSLAAPLEMPYLHAVALIDRVRIPNLKFSGLYGGNGWREDSEWFISAVEAGERCLLTGETKALHLKHDDRGGCRDLGELADYYWSVRNTAVFIRRHWTFLRPWLGLEYGPGLAILKFSRRLALDRLGRRWPGLVRWNRRWRGETAA